MKAWTTYCKSGSKPADIPAAPNTVYATNGWIGVGDWLGTDTVATHGRVFLSFEEARAVVRALGLKHMRDWKDYCKSGKRPANIPSYPNEVYAEKGWAGYGDWLGTGNISGGQHK